MLWVLKRDGSFEHPKHMLKLMGKKIFRFTQNKKKCLSKPGPYCLLVHRYKFYTPHSVMSHRLEWPFCHRICEYIVR